MSRDLKIDDVQRLADLLTSRDRDADKDRVPDWADPKRYPRHARVSDPDATKAIEDLDILLNELRVWYRKRDVLTSKLTIMQSELYERLEAVHPEVLVARRGGSGLRDWQGAWWYVGWDHQRYADETDASSETWRGTYR